MTNGWSSSLATVTITCALLPTGETTSPEAVYDAINLDYYSGHDKLGRPYPEAVQSQRYEQSRVFYHTMVDSDGNVKAL
jgi:hypothetical protein